MLPPSSIPSRNAVAGSSSSSNTTQSFGDSSTRHDRSGSPPASSSASASASASASVSASGSGSGSGSSVLTQAAATLNWNWTPRVVLHDGAFAGRCMRFHLQVAQEPIHGRRKTEKDRRPLAHSPIVRLWIRECRRRRISDHGEEWIEEDLDLALIEPAHLVCAAELASPDAKPPLPPQPSSHPSSASSGPLIGSSGPRQLHASAGVFNPKTEELNELNSNTTVDRLRGDPSDATVMSDALSPSGWSATPSSSGLSSATPGPGPSSQRQNPRAVTQSSSMPMPSTSASRDRATRGHLQYPSSGTPQLAGTTRRRASSPDPVRRASRDGSPSSGPGANAGNRQSGSSSASMKRNKTEGGRNLYGNPYVSGMRIAAPEGGVGLWFLFTDLSVRQEGMYALRFRCFDVTAVSPLGPPPTPSLVEAMSQPFRVYSPRNFPGLPKSTELAEHFNRLGFKLNTRKNEKIAESTIPTPPSATSTVRPQPTPLQPSPEKSNTPPTKAGKAGPGSTPHISRLNINSSGTPSSDSQQQVTAQDAGTHSTVSTLTGSSSTNTTGTNTSASAVLMTPGTAGGSWDSASGGGEIRGQIMGSESNQIPGVQVQVQGNGKAVEGIDKLPQVKEEQNQG